MSTPSLVIVLIGETQVFLRRHWGGEPEVAGRHVLNLLATAKTAKPRSHIHSGSWLVRLLMADVDRGGRDLPTYEIECCGNGKYGDCDRAYIFKALPDPKAIDHFCTDVGNAWTVGYIEEPGCASFSELKDRAQWFSEDEFSSFVEEELEKGLATGKIYDVTLRDNLLGGVPPEAHG